MSRSPRVEESSRPRPLHAPVRAWALAEWALVPLRAFMGLTFIYASLQKFSNPNFFNAKSPISIQQQMIAASRVSPIHALMAHLSSFAVPIGVTIGLGELAVGVGVTLGLWTRVAAIGGALISLSLFLTVSFHAAPYFTGADIVFFFAWLPFIIAGGGSRLSLDGWIARRAALESHLATSELVAIPFTRVREMCGHYDQGRCASRAGLACDAGACPVLLGADAPTITPVALDGLRRRSVVVAAATTTAVAAGTIFAGGAVTAVARLLGGVPAPAGSNTLGGASPAPSSATTTTAPTSTSPGASSMGTLLGRATQVPLGDAATFTIPASGDPGIVVHTVTGNFVAYDAVCPHAGCTVGFSKSSGTFVCPCHGSRFQVATGAVINGPAPHGLTPLKIVEGSNGNLYLQ